MCVILFIACLSYFQIVAELRFRDYCKIRFSCGENFELGFQLLHKESWTNNEHTESLKPTGLINALCTVGAPQNLTYILSSHFVLFIYHATSTDLPPRCGISTNRRTPCGSHVQFQPMARQAWVMRDCPSNYLLFSLCKVGLRYIHRLFRNNYLVQNRKHRNLFSKFSGQNEAYQLWVIHKY